MAASSAETAPDPGLQVEAGPLILFRAGGRALALPLASVMEVAAFRTPTPVPFVDRAVLGLLSLRGRMVTLVDAGIRLGLSPRPPARGAQVIVVETGSGLVGLVVDAVTHVGAARRPESGPEPAPIGVPWPGMCRGVLKDAGGHVVLLDLDSLIRGEP
jgi:purine-binding chemotaxis protein CheW